MKMVIDMLRGFHFGLKGLLLLVCLAVLPGCWSRIEVNDRAFVTAMFVDEAEDGETEVSLGFPLPSRLSTGGAQQAGQGGDGMPYSLVSKSAESIPISIRKIQSDLPREISWGHARVIVLGRRFAEHRGIQPLVEFVTREPTFHIKAYVLISPGTAKEIAYLTPAFERFPSEILREFANRRVTLDATIKDFAEAAAYGGDFTAGLLTVQTFKMLSEKGKPSEWVGTDGAAVFQGGKMVGTLDVEGMRAAMWIRGRMKNSLISIHSPTDHKIISFLILGSKSSIRPVLNKGKLTMRVKVDAYDDVTASDSNIDLMDPQQVTRIEKLLVRQLAGRIGAALKKSQTLGADAFNFAQYVDWYYPQIWKRLKSDWRSEYKNNVRFELDVHVHVKRSGAEFNPIHVLNTGKADGNE